MRHGHAASLAEISLPRPPAPRSATALESTDAGTGQSGSLSRRAGSVRPWRGGSAASFLNRSTSPEGCGCSESDLRDFELIKSQVKVGQPPAQRPGLPGRAPKLRAHVQQVGDTIMLVEKGAKVHNRVLTSNLGSPGTAHFCDGSPRSRLRRALPKDRHPQLRFAFPVKNVHVTITDMGQAGARDARRRIIWDAIFAREKPIAKLGQDMPAQGGDVRRFEQLCPRKGAPLRLELHVTAEDPRSDDPPTGPPFEPPDLLSPDRSFDETAQFEVKLLPEGDPRLAESAGPRRRKRFAPGMAEELGLGPYVEVGGALGPFDVLLLLARPPPSPGVDRRRAQGIEGGFGAAPYAGSRRGACDAFF